MFGESQVTFMMWIKEVYPYLVIGITFIIILAFILEWYLSKFPEWDAKRVRESQSNENKTNKKTYKGEILD